MTNRVTRDQWSRIQALFGDLVDRPPAEQTRRLAAIADEAVAEQVRSLLTAVREDGILDGTPPTLERPAEAPGYSSLQPGDQVGIFAIDRLIGRGGMGEVYVAHRREAGFEQQVAIKLLRPEAVGRADLFDRERRLLAGLEHPGIARLIDGGIAPDGRPYMAMEYVVGQPIDIWCNAHRADLATRLRFFCDICEAVGYAHGKLIVHRDLKPSNMLVDADGRVRLLDFGIAHLLDDQGVARMTAALMTPDYAAPEQLGNEPATVATDIYALGAVLFELVTGRGPWRGDQATLPSVIRRILNDDPPLPSSVVGADQPFAARAVAGDIDAIVLKAMRRSPQDRYPSASALAEDVRRHLALQTVSARAGSTGYLLGRFVRRHRGAVTAAVAALLAMFIGTGGVLWQARQTAIERDVARAEARRSEAIVRMLTVMFRDTASSDAGDNATVKQMLDQTAAQLVASVDHSARSATLITTLSDLYVNLEDVTGADGLLAQALAKGIGRDDPVSTAELKLRLASTAAALGRIADMAPLLDAADAVFATDPARFRKQRLESVSARAQLARREGEYDKAIALLRSSLPEAGMVYAEDHRELLTRYNNLLVYMVEANRLDEMPPVFAEADAIMARTGQRASVQGLGIEQLKGVRLMKLGENRRAAAIFRRVADQRRAVFGKSAGLAVDLLQFGRAQLALGDHAAARTALAEARPIAIDKLGPAAVPSVIIGIGLAEASAELGDTAAAEALLTQLTPIVGAMPASALPPAILARTRAVLRLKQGRAADAAREADRAEAMFRALGAPGDSYLKSLPALRARIAAIR
ncbi:serine/threonine-protein kinase [Sphingomonas sp.]|uniref:serine/threonine-protein kinase n=1 Tax=Sphingomonas sp. TaxID=28214 RepID=UPI001EB6BCA4|nr:serine/threonine-protein kinase [Sphingomonas sp.]MBX3593004.1 serine/threonine protein kinase [Sphingomonas sp.]